MGFQIGAPIVSDKHFFGRTRSMEKLKRVIDEYYQGVINHVALLGIRRIGKSSVLKKIERELSLQGFVAIYLNLEKVEKNAAAFFVNLSEASVRKYVEVKGLSDSRAFLEEAKLKIRKSKDALVSMLSSVKLSVALAELIEIGLQLERTPLRWRECGKQLFGLLERLSREQKVVIMIDEFGLISKYPERIDLLEFLRGQLSESKVPFLLSGSQNIMRMVPEEKDFWTAILLDYRLEFWERDEVQEALQSRFDDEDYTVLDIDRVTEEVYTRTDGHPLHVNILGAILEELSDRRRGTSKKIISSDMVQAAYEEYISGRRYERQGFGYYLRRLDRDAKSIVKTIAVNEPVDIDILLQLLKMDRSVVLEYLQDLEYDFYIYRDSGSFRMADPMFRDWLKRKFGEQG